MKESVTFSYPAIFTPEQNGGYFIEFLDIPGAYTGINENNISHGVTLAKEVLKMVLTDMIEHEESIPSPSALNKVPLTNDQFVKMIAIKL